VCRIVIDNGFKEELDEAGKEKYWKYLSQMEEEFCSHY
jgi:hypothetical protein